VLFLNPLAVLLTLAGGWMFAGTHRQTGSLAIAAIEHALYGCWIFTAGLGEFFYHGTIRFAETLSRHP